MGKKPMRRPLVAGNWKMHGTRAQAEILLDGILPGLGAVKQAEVVICPPFILIPLVAEKIAGARTKIKTDIGWGGQNLSAHEPGAYTGEISGVMLRDYGCNYVIVGHSERRALFGEDDRLVAQKFQRAQASGLTPILCVGETLAEREAGQTETVVMRQLDAVLVSAGIAGFKNAVVAYEPVWAIGTGKNAEPPQAQAVHQFIRAKLAQEDPQIAAGLRILYGGSVKAANAKALFAQNDIDGGLIGGASLRADEFLKICGAAE
jgi:triosephosphate isomerase